MEKTCMKCGKLLPIDEFYKHPQMGDGHLNKCKECCRSDTIQNRRKRIEHYREYDRSRSSLPHRRKLRKQFLQYQEAIEPEKSKARTAAGNALRDGRIRKEPCYFAVHKKVSKCTTQITLSLYVSIGYVEFATENSTIWRN